MSIWIIVGIYIGGIMIVIGGIGGLKGSAKKDNDNEEEFK